MTDSQRETRDRRSGEGPGQRRIRGTIRELREQDAQIYADFRRQSLLESPLSFAASPEDDIAASPEAVGRQLRRSPESVIIGAFDPALIGAVGLYRDQYIKSSHRVHLWGMYVVPEYRNEGIGSRLLEAVLDHARSLDGVFWVDLSVSSASPEAQRLYERFGFRIWGTEPEAMLYEGESVVEHHMALRLGTASSP